MNHVYRLVWSTAKNAWVAVAETTRGRGKSSRSKTLRRTVLATLLAASGAHAQTTVVDGGGNSGCMIGVSTCNLQRSDATYTNFYTQGGAGSGGGAGLGGVFFVNSGASLSLNNVSFLHNVVKGGEGGSSPDVNVSGLTLNLLDKTADVTSVSALQVRPTLADDGNGNLSVSGAILSSANPLIKSGAVVNVTGTTGATTISNINGSTVTFGSALAVDNSAIKNLGGATLNAGTDTISVASFGSLQPSDIVAGLSVVGAGIPSGTTILDVTRDNTNAVTGIKLSNNITVGGTNASLRLVDVRSFNASQFAVSNGGTQLTLPATGLGLAVGMTLTGTGVPAGTRITAINGDEVTLSQAISSTAVGFSGSLPATVVGQNTIQLTALDSRLQVGAAISGTGIPAGTTITNIDPATGVLTLSQSLTANPTQFTSKRITAQSGTQLTLLSATGLVVGMQVEGTGIPAGTTITGINGNVVTLSSTPTGTVNGFIASSPYRVGGSLNGMSVTGANGSNGGGGVNAPSAIVYITDGEGRDGTRGGSAGNGSGGVGGNGGNGGNGSGGVPFNYEFTRDTIEKTAAAVSETAAAAGALATFPPNAVLSAAHIASATVAYAQLAVAIANLTQWGIDLSNGTAGRGGDGGGGGNGGNGSPFFGGGAGGAGGDGGSGALSFTDGGEGGSGGGGGAGGFGAGGGSGGAGGSSGGTGNSTDGDSGAGGLAGFGGGVGSNGDGLFGGGGSGFGGAIFVRNGGTLSLTGNVLFRENTVLAGSSNNGGAPGQAAGSDIFIMRGADVLLAPGNGRTIRIEGQIADDSAASIANGSYAAGAGADLRIGGGGLVQLAGTNTYSGRTILEGATLETTLGRGIHSASSVVFRGQGSLGGLNTGNAGVLLLSENVTQRAGSVVPGQFSWNGAGGFASGTASGITINFGQTAGGTGQVLDWGSSYLANNSTLVFGSEYSQGSVDLRNDINLNGNTGRVAVYGSLSASTAVPAQTAYLSGRLTNGSLQVGSAGYAGTLYLTGQNELGAFTLNTGVVSTLGTAGANGRLMRTSGGSVAINGGTLVLAGDENLTSLSVATGGHLLSVGTLTGGTAVNDGMLSYLGSTTLTNLTNNADGILNIAGTLTASGVLDNHAQGMLVQIGQITAGSAVNDGLWTVSGQRTLTTPSLTGSGAFDLATAPDLLTIDQSGNSTFAGSFGGAGAIIKTGTGTLTLTGASSHAGGTTVAAGTLDTTGGGTLVDNGAITVNTGATFRAGTVDTVGAVVNGGTLIVAADQHVASLANAGTTELAADLTSTGNVANDGVWAVSGQRTLSTAALTGSGTFDLTTAPELLTIDQSGNSTFAGTFGGAGALIKTGAGTLALTGASSHLGGTTVAAGTLDTTGGGTLADGGTIAISTGATFTAGTVDTVGAVINDGNFIVAADQYVASLANTGTTQLAANLTSAGGVVNDGLWAVSGQRTLVTPTLTGSGAFDLTTAQDLLTVDQASDSTFAGSFGGLGALIKAGASTLTLTGASSHRGGTAVAAGTLDTTGGGTLADDGAIAIVTGATFRAGTADTIGAVINGGNFIVAADQHVASLTNAGTTQLAANLTSAGTVTNEGALNVSASHTMTTTGLAGGLTGVVQLDQATDVLTLNQSQNSAYSGRISGAGSLIKTGAGTLTLDNSNVSSINIGGELVINQGTVALDGDYILDQGMDVVVNSGTVDNQQVVGTLQLINGDQSIFSLSGAGQIDLGATNRLTVRNGGNFTGSVLGSGALDIRSGSFQLDNDLISLDPTSVFELGGEDSQASTTVGSGATLQFPAVDLLQNSTLAVATGGSVVSNRIGLGGNSLLEIAAGGTAQSSTVRVTDIAKLDVQGTLNASEIVVSSTATSPDTAAVLHLGNPFDPTTRGSVTATRTEITGGVLSGNGSISGQVMMGSSSWLRPGNSPGSLQFVDLTLGNQSTAQMEIGGTAGSRVAGVDHDVIQVTGSLRIENGATLVIDQFGNGDDLARGEAIKLFDFRDGQVSGQFASVQKTYGEEALLNVSTGTVIGLGSGGYGDFHSQVAHGRNNSAMLDALMVEEAGGVRQFYGGKLVERLVAAYANGADSTSIFAQASPEAYTSLIEQGRQALFFTPDADIGSDLGEARGAFATVYTRSGKARNGGYAKYDLDADGVQVGYSMGESLIGKVSLGMEDGRNHSNTLRGSSDGLIGSLAAAKTLPVKGLYLSGRVSYAEYKTDASRQTSAGTAKADRIDSSAWLAGVGVMHLAHFERLSLRSSFEVASYSVTVDGFSETNSLSVTDALSVRELKQDGTALVAGMELSGNLSDSWLLRAGANVVHDLSGDDQEVSASVNGENAAFTVRNPGLGKTQFSVLGSVGYRMGDAGNLDLSLQTFGSKGSQASLSYSKQF
jgi:autotransporter-associated beta strand protein